MSDNALKPVLPVRPFALPLTREQLSAALQKGHGRALLHSREYGAADLTEVILDACLHNRAYDPQCEDTRADWMMQIVEAAALQSPVARAIGTRLSKSREDGGFWDATHMCRMARLLGQRGYSAARSALYGALRKNPTSLDLIGVEDIVQLDGADGLLFVVDILGSWLQEDSQLTLDDEPLRRYDEDGRAEGDARRILEQAAPSNQRITAYLSHIDAPPQAKAGPQLSMGGWTRPDNAQLNPDSLSQHKQRMRTISAERVIQEIRSVAPDQDRYWYMSWGRHASDSDLANVAAAMFDETHPGRLQKYLRVFRQRALPYFDQRLLGLADYPDREVRDATLAALANCTHPEVRCLAVSRIRQARVCEGELKLLTHNYRAGDGRLIEAALVVPENPDELHSIVYDLVSVIKANRDADLADVMLFVYEYSPCSNCRGAAVKALIDTATIPGWVRDECRYDASEQIRGMAERFGADGFGT